MIEIEWSQLALIDRDAIFDYIERDDPQAAVAIDQRIEAEANRLGDFPEIGRPGELRELENLLSVKHNTFWRIASRTVASSVCFVSCMELGCGPRSFPKKAQCVSISFS